MTSIEEGASWKGKKDITLGKLTAMFSVCNPKVTWTECQTYLSKSIRVANLGNAHKFHKVEANIRKLNWPLDQDGFTKSMGGSSLQVVELVREAMIGLMSLILMFGFCPIQHETIKGTCHFKATYYFSQSFFSQVVKFLLKQMLSNQRELPFVFVTVFKSF